VTTIHHQLRIAVPAAAVYAALATAEAISTWWHPQTAVQTEHGLVLEHHPGPEHGVVKLLVVGMVPGTRVEWECVSTHPGTSPASAWTGTHFLFEIAEREGVTTLDFRQTGYDERSPFLGANTFAWAQVLQRLKMAIESQARARRPASAVRVEPVSAPYPPELQQVFDAIMPHGVPPLALFTTLARVPRVWDRFRAGSLLDRGPVALRHREIVIARTCARCGCAYEWGVHVAFFASRASLTPGQVRATMRGDAGDPAWSDDERLLIHLVDELHDGADISDALWQALAVAFTTEQILELIALVGFYHTVSFFANGLRLPAEPFAAPPP
jgi:4-carboxymuconolactone decarboxylase